MIVICSGCLTLHVLVFTNTSNYCLGGDLIVDFWFKMLKSMITSIMKIIQNVSSLVFFEHFCSLF
jgi:hypothetical protein